MQKTLCERKGHERVGWAILGASFLGMGAAYATLTLMPEAIDGLTVLSWLMTVFCVGVYAGVIKLDAPKKKAKVASQEAKPEPQPTKE